MLLLKEMETLTQKVLFDFFAGILKSKNGFPIIDIELMTESPIFTAGSKSFGINNID